MELKKECLGKVAITIEKDYHSPNKAYDKLVIVEQEGAYKTYISRKAVPADTPLTNREYWIPFSSLAEELQLDYNRYKSKLEIELTELKENFNSFSNANKEIIKLIDDHINSIGKPNGVAQLDDSGKVPSEQLPSYVDDVIEFDTLDAFPQVGEKGKIYVDKDTNKTYRWSGSIYIEISNPLKPNEINGIKTIIDHYPILYNPQSSSHFYFLQGGEDITLHVPYYDPASKEIKVLSGDEQKIHVATTTRAGIMTANDKQLLESLPSTIITRIDFEHGENYTTSFTGYQLVDGKYVNTGEQDITPSIASASYNGLMSKEDKIKLDNIRDTQLLTDKQKQILDNINNYGIVFGSQSSNENIFQVFYYSDNLELGIYGYSASNPSTENKINNKVKLPLATEDNPGIISRATAKHIEATKSALEQIILTNDESYVDDPVGQCVTYSFNYKTIVNGEVGEETLYIDAPYATTRQAGLISADDKNKLDSIDVADLDFITDAELNEILI